LKLQFKSISLEDRDLFRKYIGDYPFKTYEYSFATLYLWRKLNCAQYGILKDALIVRKKEHATGLCFMPPLGYRREDLCDIVNELEEYRAKCGTMEYLFRDVEEPFLVRLKEQCGARLVVSEDVDNFDYIYESKELIALDGRALHSKKNHYHHFTRTYPYATKDMHEPGVVDDCLAFSENWFRERGEDGEQLKVEHEGIRDILGNMDYLGLQGMAVYVANRVAGFTVGERVNDEMAVIHIEKADTEYGGIYAFINKAFVEQYYSQVRYINREEDLGIEGLRKAKESYRPVRLEKKYLVKLV
jgi:uncharacterized protein